MVTPGIKGFYVLGLMSGTSLDGLDIALCYFYRENKKWNFLINKATTVLYPRDLQLALATAHQLNAGDLVRFDHSYGEWIADQCNLFLEDSVIKPCIIASHGHTVFHQPEKGFTFQIGNGHDIAVKTGIPVVYDFRSMDVALGGNGAPLVPVGDELLFPGYEYCLNLGGFSNISYAQRNKRVAYDICPVNIALNYMSRKSGFEFDQDGKTGKKGILIEPLLKKLNNLAYYNFPPPKSLKREWFENEFVPCLLEYENVADVLRTLYEHMSDQIASQPGNGIRGRMLVTGGGAKNKFLVSLLSEKCMNEIVVPDESLIDYKEAMIFGFLGLLRYMDKTNCYGSVTGAKRNSSSGIIIKI